MSDVRGQKSAGKDRMSDVGCLGSRDRRSEGKKIRRSEKEKPESQQPGTSNQQLVTALPTSNQQPLFCPGTSNPASPQLRRTGQQPSSSQSTNQPINQKSAVNLEPGTWNLKPHFTNQPKIRATFFVLGWIAKRLPAMVREIYDRGHEVGSHGLDHELPSKMSEGSLVDDLAGSRKMLEDTIGAPVQGYRAPSFAVDDHILRLIQQAGYLYDSSYNSFSFHGRYGRLSLNGNGTARGIVQIDDGFFEIPISNLLLFQKVLPWGGGGYFRLMPSFFFKAGVKAILKDRQSFVFYLHPWEIDPHQPRVNKASFPLKFRHYNNLKWTEAKLVDLIKKFKGCRFSTCADYISQKPQKLINA
jgi:polysaccharide deacetylase family protein (PEP-CTERM system associated)